MEVCRANLEEGAEHSVATNWMLVAATRDSLSPILRVRKLILRHGKLTEVTHQETAEQGSELKTGSRAKMLPP